MKKILEFCALSTFVLLCISTVVLGIAAIIADIACYYSDLPETLRNIWLDSTMVFAIYGGFYTLWCELKD